jgi:predicted Zn-dependent protease
MQSSTVAEVDSSAASLSNSDPTFAVSTSEPGLEPNLEAIAPPEFAILTEVTLNDAAWVAQVPGAAETSEPTAADETEDMEPPATEAEVETESEAELPAELPTETEGQTPEAASPEDDATEAETAETDDTSDSTDSAAGETDDTETADGETEAEAADRAAAERRLQLLIEGDRLFMQGQFAEADRLYRQAKAPEGEAEDLSDANAEISERPQPITDPAQLSPAGQVYWREVEAGRESGLETRVEVPLQLLTEEHPEFIPGQLAYADYLIARDRPEEALSTLERSTSLYPNEPRLVQAQVETLAASEQWLPAAIAARQFALLNPDHPQAEEFAVLADDYEGRFRSRMRNRLVRRTIGNVLAGAAGFVVTGNPFGPLAALETTIMMARGESNVGESIANRANRELEMVTDEEVVAYVNEIGQEMAEFAGRDEFEYEFYVVQDDDLNAFALPGGKVFINAGAILATETGAELAGLVAHELAHAVLSHGFQLMTGGNLTANVFQFIPYGGLATNLAVLSYSRGMERQADALGTRLLANSRYAADGLARLMRTLDEENEGRRGFEWLSSHPDTPERIRNLEEQIDANGYDRYAFEGAERHLEIQARVREILAAAEDDDIDTSVESDDSESPKPDPTDTDTESGEPETDPGQ